MHGDRAADQHWDGVPGDEFASIMDYVQALFSFFIAPLFGTVILGMLWKRATKRAGFWGLLAGTFRRWACGRWVKFDPQRWVQMFALSPDAKGWRRIMYRSAVGVG